VDVLLFAPMIRFHFAFLPWRFAVQNVRVLVIPFDALFSKPEPTTAAECGGTLGESNEPASCCTSPKAQPVQADTCSSVAEPMHILDLSRNDLLSLAQGLMQENEAIKSDLNLSQMRRANLIEDNRNLRKEIKAGEDLRHDMCKQRDYEKRRGDENYQYGVNKAAELQNVTKERDEILDKLVKIGTIYAE
jgi:hypothetical protein